MTYTGKALVILAIWAGLGFISYLFNFLGYFDGNAAMVIALIGFVLTVMFLLLDLLYRL